MPRWKLPPRIKYLEGLGAVADGRVSLIDEKHAEVQSSEGDRVYHVFIDTENKIISSDDNGSMYKGYLGYPAISVMMVKGILPFGERERMVADGLKGIDWKMLNQKYKNYYITEKIVRRIAEKRGVSGEMIDEVVRNLHDRLKELLKVYSRPSEPNCDRP